MTTNLEEIFSSNIKRLREAHDLTQEQLAERSNVSLQTIWRAEHNSLPKGDTIQKLAHAFNVKIEELFSPDSANLEFRPIQKTMAEMTADDFQQTLVQIIRKTMFKIKNDELFNELNDLVQDMSDEEISKLLLIAKALKK